MSTAKRPAAKSSQYRVVQSLEGTVLRVLGEHQAPPPGKGGAKWVPLDQIPLAPAKKAALKRATFRKPVAKKAAPPFKVEPPLRRTEELAKAAREFRAQLQEMGLLHVETVRVRPEGMDRQLRVEYASDPGDPQAVLMRVSLASKKPLPASASMMTTQQAADYLNVSRPYITRMVDAGKVFGVQRTQSGHRRIPAAEVERLQLEMRSTRRKALNELVTETKELRERELSAAKTKSKRHWVAKA